MSFVEGVGDEVVWFASLMFGFLIALVAWWSTGYRHNRLRTVVVMDRNMRHIYRAFVQHPVTFSIHRNVVRESVEANSSSNDSQTRDIPLRDPQANNIDHLIIDGTEDNTDSSPRSTDEGEIGDLAGTEQIAEMESIVSAMDSETNIVRNRRVAFFQQQPRNEQTADSDTNNVTSTVTDPASASLPQRLAKIMNRQSSTIPVPSGDCDADQLSGIIESSLDDSEKNTPEVTQTESEAINGETPRSEDSIRIRLKYLNDDQKLVEASLQEQLGDFKRRHFSRELASRGGSLVRLVFAGRLLREADTLRDAGLYDNCVVHCLIHQPRNQQFTSPDGSPLNAGQNDNMDGGSIPQRPQDRSETPENSPNREWDLGHALFTLVSMILTVAWYCHFQYGHLFGAAASVALLILTGLYGMAMMGVYYPDQQFQQFEPQNAAPNANQG